MPKVGTVSIDGDATPDAFTVLIPCRFMQVRENAAAGTTQYDVYDPDTTVTPIRMVEGETYTFDAGEHNLYQGGQIAGYGKAVTVGSYVFSKKCF